MAISFCVYDELSCVWPSEALRQMDESENLSFLLLFLPIHSVQLVYLQPYLYSLLFCDKSF